MGQGKKTAVYLGAAAALTLLLMLAFPGFWLDCAASVSTGRQTIRYTRVSMDSEGTVYAAGVRDGTWVLARGTLAGKRESFRTLDSLGITDVVAVDRLYACSDGGLALSLYEQKTELFCRVYHLGPDDDEARMIYSASCRTQESVKIDGLTEQGGVITFLLRQGTGSTAFRYIVGEASAEQVKSAAAEADAAMFVLRDGQFAAASEGMFTLGSTRIKLPGEMRPIEGWRLTGGACLLDGASGALWRMDVVTGTRAQIAAPDEMPVLDIVSTSVSPDGGVLFLTDDGELMYLSDETFQDCTGALYRPRWLSILILVLSAAGVLLAALVVRYFWCEYRKLQASLVLRNGLVVALLLVLLIAAAARWVVVPYFESWADWEAERYLVQAASDTASAQDVQRMSFRMNDGLLYRVDDGERTALSGLGLGAAWRQAAERTLRNGNTFQRHNTGGIDYYSYFIRNSGNQLTVIRTQSAPYLERADRGVQMITWLLYIIAGLTLAAVLLELFVLRQRLRRVTKGMDALHAGTEHMRVVDWAGDEVGAMADSLNALAATLQKAGAADLQRGGLYARFLPARIAQLLGEGSVDQINKQSFASSRMTTMHVSFSFDERVYGSRSKALFDNINEITECTARVISAKGGTILSFSHEGFDAFFPAGDDAPISAAVVICQEAAAINRSRQRRNISPVSLHIALAEGDVMLGVVGDENRMQATAVSSCFSATRMLTGLFSKFEAGILCTQEIESRAGSFGRRFIGKAHDGAELVRVYELYDGDAQSVRQSKAETERAFSDGVYTLYAGDYSAAKRTFMEISRRNGGDGAAKFYLYLADRFEKEPPEEVSLDG